MHRSSTRFPQTFAFAILVSIFIDVALQLNVWRVIGVSGLRAQELASLQPESFRLSPSGDRP